MIVRSAFTLAAVAMAVPFTAYPQDFPNAVARRGCTQEDLPALEIILTGASFDGKGDPRRPNLQIEIGWGDFEKLVGKDSQLIPLNRNESPSAPVIRAVFTPEQGAPVWLSGKLRLTLVEIDKRVEGCYKFAAPDKTVWKGRFKASWAAAQPRCG